MSDPEFTAKLGGWLKGHEAAVQLVSDLVEVAHVWDDLVDKDQDVPAEDLHSAFTKALLHIPANPFYQQNFQNLHPLLSLAIINWQTATKIERARDSAHYPIAFIIRSDYANLVLKCAELVGGLEWAAAIALDVRLFWHEEGLAGYTSALTQERLMREGD